MSTTCVIIGGGYSGQAVAKNLVKAGVKVTIVQANPFAEQPIFGPYFLTRPELYAAKANTKKGSVASLETVGIDGVSYVVGTVTSLGDDGDKTVVLEDGRTIEFGALVVAAGNHYPAIMANLGEDFATRLAFVQAFPAKVSAANKILVGGAGPVALEMAAELRRLNPTCEIQMVTSGDTALSSWTGTPAAVLASRLKDTNIQVKTNARVVLPTGSAPAGVYEKAEYMLSTGEGVKDVDLFLPYFGQPRTGFLPADTVVGGKVRVNANGQSTVRANLFAVGCGDRHPVAVMPVIDKEAEVVAANVHALLGGQDKLPASLPDKPPTEHVAVVHLGLGLWSAMNLEQKGCVPGLMARCCGCCFPICPCCAFCDWCCTYPAGTCAGSCFEKVLIGMAGNFHEVHAVRKPEMQAFSAADMSR